MNGDDKLITLIVFIAIGIILIAIGVYTFWDHLETNRIVDAAKLAGIGNTDELDRLKAKWYDWGGSVVIILTGFAVIVYGVYQKMRSPLKDLYAAKSKVESMIGRSVRNKNSSLLRNNLSE